MDCHTRSLHFTLPSANRTPQEVESWRKKDPRRGITQYPIEQRLLAEADEERIEAEVKAIVDTAAKAAEAAATPEPASAYRKVFARPLRTIPGAPDGAEIGRASCRGRVCRYV